ncbi:MAG TPA: hypothetical protein VF707_03070 [Ardenticatenaceae bacterium]|jgi:hypothetical protein
MSDVQSDQSGTQDGDNGTWDGSPVTINQDQSKQLAPAPNGTLVFAYQNTGTTTSAGEVTLTAGGGQPTSLPAPAGTNQPEINVRNWKGNTLSVSNTSDSATPIWIAAMGPGQKGVTPTNLPADGTSVTVDQGKAVQGTAVARYMRLNLRAPSGNLTIFAIVGGPTDKGGNNAHVIAVNGQDTVPEGYYASTSNNYYSYEFNWGSATVFVANLSPQASSGTVSLAQL